MTRARRKNWGSALCAQGNQECGLRTPFRSYLQEDSCDVRSGPGWQVKMLCVCFSCWSHRVFAHPRGLSALPPCPDLQILVAVPQPWKSRAENTGRSRRNPWHREELWMDTLVSAHNLPRLLCSRRVMGGRNYIRASYAGSSSQHFPGWLRGGEIKTCL